MAAAKTAWRSADLNSLSDETLAQLDGWFRAANYLSVGQIYLLSNPLLRTPLSRDDVKPRLLGHWGTTPGLNFIYAHLNRVIKERGQSTIYVTGPGHGGPGLVANAYLDGTYSEVYSDITGDVEGIRRLFRQFSFPGGIPSHVAPETPGSIHEGGELGYALSHAYGAAFDNPDLLVAAVVGDGEAETGALATSWHSNKFMNPTRDGVVLPLLHLNGYKIANPTIFDRIPVDELHSLMVGYGHNPYFFEVKEGDETADAHRRFASLLDTVLNEISEIKERAAGGVDQRPRWPMIIFRTPKGWTGPDYIDGKKTTGSWRAHQVPLASARDTPEHLQVLADWLASYRVDELFDEDGKLDPKIADLAPRGALRMSDNPHANGGLLLKDLRLPDFRDYGVDVPAPGSTFAEATRVLGQWLTDVIRLNPDNFRIFGPDETASNRLQAVFDVTAKQWNAEFFGPEVDERLAHTGRVVEMLSEHQCQGWLEGYLLTGRHGLFNCYEAFIHIIDSMFNQHAKWLKVTNHIPWRRPVASLNYLLSSHVLAAGPQRVQPSGPRLHRPCGEQARRGGPGLSTAGCEHPSLHIRPLPALTSVRQRGGRGQAAQPELAGHAGGDRALHQGARHLGMGGHRGTRRGSRRRHRGGGRRPYAGGPCGSRPAPAAPAGSEDSVRERR
jgi:xylulose-5-phosphate/fructose-6-phosphate phosphoketolase